MNIAGIGHLEQQQWTTLQGGFVEAERCGRASKTQAQNCTQNPLPIGIEAFAFVKLMRIKPQPLKHSNPS
jgi:hypothetical protein